MALYAIGDLQGCLDPLLRLLDELDFDPRRDRLWFAGDLVNRGPQSLETLRFVKGLGEAAITVLGNHDLHLLAVATGLHKRKKKDTLDPIYDAPDRDELLHWLQRRPLLHYDAGLGMALVHAGLPPQWDIALAQQCAAEMEAVLREGDAHGYFLHMYGNHPARWSEDLVDWERLRFITNCLTRLRYCTLDGILDMEDKGPPGTQKNDFIPWFEVPGRRSADTHVLFGHWAALGVKKGEGYTSLDSGCVWGNRLTAVRLDGGERHFVSVACGA